MSVVSVGPVLDNLQRQLNLSSMAASVRASLSLLMLAAASSFDLSGGAVGVWAVDWRG